MAKATPRIANGILSYHDGVQERRVAVGDAAWWHWLAGEGSTTFRYANGGASFTARRERKHRRSYWYAYKRQGSTLRKVYLGKTDDMSLDRLDSAAHALAQPQPGGDNHRASRPSRTRGESGREPLLPTKLVIPVAPPDTIARPRLNSRLERAGTRKLTLISAPAGFGKTTLLSHWAARSPWPVAWVSLDSADNDPTRFWSYFVAALNQLESGIAGGVVALLTSQQPAPISSALDRLLAALASLSRDLVLVLDDYHLIDAEGIHEGITFLLDHIPARAHLVIASRVDPPLPLARLRVRDHLVEIRATDLRFMPEEAAAFFRVAAQLELPDDDLAALAERTEGWIAGLKLAALALQDREDRSEVLARFNGTHRHIADYLADEVLRRQDPALQRFLLETSILDRLSAPLCDAVTGRNDARKTLEWLDRANMFLVPLDEARCWYRYHHFFGEFLRERLRQEHDDGWITLHQRAARWYTANHLASNAIEHWLMAEDWEQAADVIDELARAMFLPDGERANLRRWLDQLPEPVLRARARLCVAHAWSLVWGDDMEAAEQRLLSAEQVLVGSAVEAQHLHSEIAVLRSSAALRHDNAPEAIALARQAIQDLPAGALALRGIASMNLGTAHLLRGEFEAAGAALAKAVEWSEGGGYLRSALIATNNLAYVQVMQGRLRQAADTYRRAIRFTAMPDTGAVQRATGGEMAYVGYGEVLREWNDLAGAESFITEGMALARQTHNDQVALAGYVELARLQQAQGDLRKALATIAEGVELGQTSRIAYWSISRTVAATQARLFIAHGDVDQAGVWAQERRLPLHNTRARLIDEHYEYITLAQLLLAQQRPAEAVDLLLRLREVLDDAGYHGPLIDILALQALSLARQDHHEQALLVLEEAATLAGPQGYVRTFLDYGRTMLDLLRNVAPARRASSYLRTLVAMADGTDPDAGSAAGTADLYPMRIEPLSRREQEILRLIAAGRTNADIAATLLVATSTVKWHAKQIYGKLGVHNRVQAVGLAREYGILE